MLHEVLPGRSGGGWDSPSADAEAGVQGLNATHLLAHDRLDSSVGEVFVLQPVGPDSELRRRSGIGNHHVQEAVLRRQEEKEGGIRVRIQAVPIRWDGHI